MPTDHTQPEPSPYRVTLFFGPEEVEGRPSISACVFNVKKRSWKGGIQVAVEVTDEQLEAGRMITDFRNWIAEALLSLPSDERVVTTKRADELFVQAICWAKLDLLLEAGITQETQRLTSETATADLMNVVRRRAAFIISYVASELDLTPRDTAAH